MSDPTSELLPCPFCGSSNIVLHRSPVDTAIVCKNCGSEGPSRLSKECFNSAAGLRDKWNTRIKDARIAELEKVVKRHEERPSILEIVKLEAQLAESKEATKGQAMLNLAYMDKYNEHLLRIARLEHRKEMQRLLLKDCHEAFVKYGMDCEEGTYMPRDHQSMMDQLEVLIEEES